MTAMPMTNQQSVSAFRGASVDVVDLTLAYGPIEVVREVSLHVDAGTTTCVIGPSGVMLFDEVTSALDPELVKGRVVEAGTPAQLFDNPQSPRLQRFLSEML